MSTDSMQLTVAGIQVRRDEEGRYCLTDLYRASGGEKRHQPSNWLKNQQTIELVKEVSIPGNPGIFTKQGVGTFICKELVYAYAMWISPQFNLKVIRAYDETVTQQHRLPAPLNETQRIALYRDALELLRDVNDGRLDDRDRLLFSDAIRNIVSPKDSFDAGITISDRISQLGFGKQDNAVMSKVGKAVAKAYRNKYGAEPPNRTQYVDGAPRQVKHYTHSDLDIIDDAIYSVLKTGEVVEFHK